MSWKGEKQRHAMSSRGIMTNTKTTQKPTNGPSKHPKLNMLYSLLKDHVRPIDKRSTHLSYTANIKTLESIYKILTKEFGNPTLDHPMVQDFEWITPDGYKIHVMKAASLTGQHMIHRIEIWKHKTYGPGVVL